MVQHRDSRKATAAAAATGTTDATATAAAAAALGPSGNGGARVPLNVRLQQLMHNEALGRDAILGRLRAEYGDGVVANAQTLIEDALHRRLQEEQTRPDMSGWLIKAAHKMGQKKSRFFELRGSMVRYFADEQEGRGANEKGFFVMGDESDVVCSDMTVEIVNTDRTWLLFASSAEDAQAWAKALLGKCLVACVCQSV